MSKNDSFEGHLVADLLIAMGWFAILVAILRCAWLVLAWATEKGGAGDAFLTTMVWWPAGALLLMAAGKLIRLVGTLEWRSRQPARTQQPGSPDWDLLRAAGRVGQPEQVVGAGLERHDKP